MKKIGLFIIMFLSFMLVPKAQEYLKYDWTTLQGESTNYLYYDAIIHDTNDYYVTISLDSYNAGIIRNFSKDKTLIWEKYVDDGAFYSVTFDDKYYYVLMVGKYDDDSYDELYLLRYCKEDGTFDETKDKVKLGSALGYPMYVAVYDGEVFIHDGIIYAVTSDENAKASTNSSSLGGANRVFKVNIEDFTFAGEVKYSELQNTKDITDNRDLILSNDKWETFENDKALGTYSEYWISNQVNISDYTYLIGEGKLKETSEMESFILKVDNNGNVIWKQVDKTLKYFDITSPRKDIVVILAYQDG